MSDLFGFCPAHANDIPLGSDRWCSEHQTLCLPPSWSSQTAVYPAWPPRPAGYVYAPRQLQESKKPAAPTSARKPFTKHKNATAQPRKRKPFTSAPARQRLPARQHVRMTYALTCQQCGKTVEVNRQGGPSRAYCSAICRDRAGSERKRLGISTETILCAQCGAKTPAYGARGSVRRRYCGAACRTRWNRAHDPRSKQAAEVAA